MFFKKFTDKREEKDRSIVIGGRRCRRKFGEMDDRTGFLFKWNKTRRDREVEYVAERISNERRGGFEHP